jgi:hypothetical protein
MATGKKILYFIAGTSPTKDEELAAAKLNTKMFRNAFFATEEINLEVCDAVAGAAPEPYLKKYPLVTKVEELFETAESPLKPPPESPVIAPQPAIVPLGGSATGTASAAPWKKVAP